MKLNILIIASICIAKLTSASFAQNAEPLQIAPLSSSHTRTSVSHTILGLRLGQSGSEAREAVLAHSGEAFAVRTTNSKHGRRSGEEVGFSYESQFYTKSNRRRAAGRDDLTVTLGTAALEGRVVGITRDVTLTKDHAETTDDLVAVMLTKYGEPSLIYDGGQGVTMLYAYDGDGFIKDLKEVSEYLFATKPSNVTHTAFGYNFHGGVPCLTPEPDLRYRFLTKRVHIGPASTCAAFLRIDISKFRLPIQMRFVLEDQAAARAQVRYLDALIKGPPTATPTVEFKP